MTLEPQDYSKVSLIAFYLPQFYPFPENDRWWGKGFTEWTNVTKSTPMFSGHYQPHLPADLGFYDLRLRETRHEQAKLAKSFGISAFCYHYYWFAGKRLLEKPLDAMLQDRELDMPFCLCWANENWTRRWDGADQEILMPQDYHAHDDEQFVTDLLPYFRDPRYFRIGSAPLFVIYRPQQIPNIQQRLEYWRERFSSHGINVHFCSALTHGNEDYLPFGFDSGVEFPPHNLTNLQIVKSRRPLDFFNGFNGTIIEFESLAKGYLKKNYNGSRVFKCVVPCWDNTARKKNQAVIVLDGTPANFEIWLRRAVDFTAENFHDESKLVFINAWNEWAEGCHLEPDQKYGLEYLRTVQRVLSGLSRASEFVMSEDADGGEDPATAFCSVTRRNGADKHRSISSKVVRELKRISLQVSQGKLRVALGDADSGLLVHDPVGSRKAPKAASAAPDLRAFTDYEYDVDLTSDSAAAQVVRLVGQNKKVLEIGAGSGAITRHLVQQNKCAVTALEINPRSIQKLRSFTDDIHDCDLNNESWPNELENSGPFDCVVAADVLEHLYDPWRVLAGMESLLKPGGEIVLSLPHAGHCTVLGCLYQEDLEYKDWGLLDKTHIRFFGIHNIEGLLESANLSLVDARWVIRRPDQTEFADLWRELPNHVRRSLQSNKYSHVYQVITKSMRTAESIDNIRLSDFPFGSHQP